MYVDAGESSTAGAHRLSYLTIDEQKSTLELCVKFMKSPPHPEALLLAMLQLCSRLTRNHDLASLFIRLGGLEVLLQMPLLADSNSRLSRHTGFTGIAFSTVILRHVIEDPITLEASMSAAIKNSSSPRNGGKISAKNFLTSLAGVLHRDPTIFLKATTSTCRLVSGSNISIAAVEPSVPTLSKESDAANTTEAAIKALLDSLQAPTSTTTAAEDTSNKKEVFKTLPKSGILQLLTDFVCSYLACAECILNYDGSDIIECIIKQFNTPLNQEAGRDEQHACNVGSSKLFVALCVRSPSRVTSLIVGAFRPRVCILID